MAKYIERARATDALINNTSLEGYDLEEAVNAICAIPAADVRSVVRGKWKEDWETGCSECSACGESYLWEDYDGVGEWNFCPNCGAKMEG